MYRLAILFTLFIMFFISACEKADSLGLADDEFLVVATGDYVKCSNYLYRFRSSDKTRLKRFFNVEDVQIDPVGLLNLDVEYKAGEQIVVKIRKLTADENRPCTADVAWYNKIWVLEHRTL